MLEEAWLEVAREASRDALPARWRPWLFMIARRHALGHLRSLPGAHDLEPDVQAPPVVAEVVPRRGAGLLHGARWRACPRFEREPSNCASRAGWRSPRSAGHRLDRSHGSRAPARRVRRGAGRWRRWRADRRAGQRLGLPRRQLARPLAERARERLAAAKAPSSPRRAQERPGRGDESFDLGPEFEALLPIATSPRRGAQVPAPRRRRRSRPLPRRRRAHEAADLHEPSSGGWPTSRPTRARRCWTSISTWIASRRATSPAATAPVARALPAANSPSWGGRIRGRRGGRAGQRRRRLVRARPVRGPGGLLASLHRVVPRPSAGPVSATDEALWRARQALEASAVGAASSPARCRPRPRQAWLRQARNFEAGERGRARPTEAGCACRRGRRAGRPGPSTPPPVAAATTTPPSAATIEAPARAAVRAAARHQRRPMRSPAQDGRRRRAGDEMANHPPAAGRAARPTHGRRRRRPRRDPMRLRLGTPAGAHATGVSPGEAAAIAARARDAFLAGSGTSSPSP